MPFGSNKKRAGTTFCGKPVCVCVIQTGAGQTYSVKNDLLGFRRLSEVNILSIYVSVHRSDFYKKKFGWGFENGQQAIYFIYVDLIINKQKLVQQAKNRVD